MIVRSPLENDQINYTVFILKNMFALCHVNVRYRPTMHNIVKPGNTMGNSIPKSQFENEQLVHIF